MNSLNRFDSYAESIKKAERAKERKIKREAKALELGHKKKVKKKKSPTLSKLKKELWKEISLYVRKSGIQCITCGGIGSVACHIVPSSEAGITRYFLPNIYLGCLRCNYLEFNNRATWARIRFPIAFGQDYVDALYEYSQVPFDFDKHWVIEQIERMRMLNSYGLPRVYSK
jgi:hypothetical protein